MTLRTKEFSYYRFMKHFTLIEIIIVFAILIGIMGSILLIMNSGFSQSISGQEKLEGAGNASFFIRYLRNDFQNAKKVVIPSGSASTIDIYTSREGERLMVRYEANPSAVESQPATGFVTRTIIDHQDPSKKGMVKKVAKSNIFNVVFEKYDAKRSKFWGFWKVKSKLTRYLLNFELIMNIKGRPFKKKKGSVFTPFHMNAKTDPDLLWKENKDIDTTVKKSP